MSVGSILITAAPIFAGLFLVKEDNMPLWLWLVFIFGLIALGVISGHFFDTRFGKEIIKTQDKWIGKHSKK